MVPKGVEHMLCRERSIVVRFSNDLETIRQAGFEITINRPETVGHCTATNDIAYRD